jgi:hypothetical protein
VQIGISNGKGLKFIEKRLEGSGLGNAGASPNETA